MKKIKSAWESPATDEGEYFNVGSNRFTYDHPENWKVGRIEHVLDNTLFNFGSRLFIYDDKGEERLSFPPRAMAWEFEVE